MRLERVELNKRFAELTGEVTAAYQAAKDPSAMHEIIKQAQDASRTAAQEQVGDYVAQLKELEQQVTEKDAKIKGLEVSGKKASDEVMELKLHAKIGAEKRAALLEHKELLEKKLEMAAAETQRLQESKAEVRINR